jgi:rSAM/selenodomain-associated transferase 1
MSRVAQLVVMAKRPELGRVKTRLARGLGAVAATRFYRQTTYDLIRRMSADQRWQTVLALSPERTVHEPGLWPRDVPRVGQGTGDLGDRMGRLMRDLPAGPVVIIGSDIPDISRAHIAAAFRALGSNDAVIGPADDGGYWLIGLRRRARVPEIFDNVRWSGEHTRADTLWNVTRERLSLATLPVLDDIDTKDDFDRWSAKKI